NTDAVLRSLTERLQSTFALQASAVLLRGPSGWRTSAVSGNLATGQRVECNRAMNATASWVSSHGESSGLPSEHTRFLPLSAGDRPVGVLQIVFRPGSTVDDERERLIATFANGA